MDIHRPQAPTFSWKVEEETLISAVRTSPFALEPKVVYAEWLEANGETRAAFLREVIEAQQNETPFPDSEALPNDWLQALGYPLLSQGRANDLEEVADELVRVSRSVIDITPVETADSDIPIGASKFNGDPDLPVDFEWPTFIENPNENVPVPLLFVAQISLTELIGHGPESNLPKSGLLSVFGAMGDGIEPRGEDGDCQLFYFPESAVLQRRVKPECHKEWADCFESAKIEFATGWDLPGAEDDWVDADPPFSEESKPNFDEDQWEQVDVMREDIWSDSHLFGYSVHQRTCNPSPGPQWQHLLTLGSVCGWCWCDGEHFAVFVHRDDLKEGKFDRVFGYCS